MRLFELETDLDSFTYPIIKIIISIFLIFLCIVRNYILKFSSVWLNSIVAILCFGITIASVLCIYISVGELFYVYSNLTKASLPISDVHEKKISEVTEIVYKNDIIEITVYIDNKTINIGASSENKYSSTIFENKLYYISNVEYDTIDEFSDALTKMFPSGNLPVIKIDDVSIEG